MLQLRCICNTKGPVKSIKPLFLFSYFLLVLLILLGASRLVLASPLVNFYNLKLESLTEYKSEKTSTLLGRPSLWVLFQPNCSSCKSQLNDLACLPKSFSTIALGVGGSRKKLKQVLKGSLFDGKRWKASAKLEQQWSDKITPTSYIVNAQGAVKKKIIGNVKCKKIKQELKKMKL